MDLQIRLDDERLCGGCPFDGNKKTCQGGFVHELGLIKEIPRDRGYDPYAGIFGYRDEGATITKFTPIRPQSCLLANERTDKAIKAISEKEQVTPKPKQENAARPTCRSCFRAHPSYEGCRKGRA